VGLLFKIVIISIVLLYIVTKVGGFIFRNVYWLLGNEAVRKQQEDQAKANPRRPFRNSGNVRVDHVREPNGQGRPAGRHDSEYVDYEEVK
jgi:hypothetical protein